MYEIRRDNGVCLMYKSDRNVLNRSMYETGIGTFMSNVQPQEGQRQSYFGNCTKESRIFSAHCLDLGRTFI